MSVMTHPKVNAITEDVTYGNLMTVVCPTVNIQRLNIICKWLQLHVATNSFKVLQSHSYAKASGSRIHWSVMIKITGQFCPLLCSKRYKMF